MGTKLFGKFLVEREAITPMQLNDALSVQKKDIYFFGELAIMKHIMTHQHVIHVIDEQMNPNHRGKKFGDIAISLGYIADSDIEDILNFQGDTHRKTGDILVAHGALTREKCNCYLNEFKDI